MLACVHVRACHSTHTETREIVKELVLSLQSVGSRDEPQAIHRLCRQAPLATEQSHQPTNLSCEKKASILSSLVISGVGPATLLVIQFQTSAQKEISKAGVWDGLEPSLD